jgi:tetratricopeptide (TPR) repeat protein
LQTLQADLSLDATSGFVAPSNAAAADDALARYGLGMAFRQRGYFDEARREFDRALAIGEDASLARHALAELDLVAGQFVAARAALEQLLAEQPDSARFWNEYGVALHQGGELEGAADSYRRALRLDPRYALAYNNLGVALSDLGEASPAREALRRAIDLEPTLARAQLNLARWFVRHRDPLAALTLLRELVAFQPANADGWHALGTVLQALHRPEEARTAFSTAIDHRPDHAEARYSLAELLGSLGDDDGALRETQRALGLSPMRADVRLSVGIDLQHECPEAAGALDLLAIRAQEPLVGVSIGEADVAVLLARHVSSAASAASAASDAAETSASTTSTRIAADHSRWTTSAHGDSESALATWCDEADAFAARGALGEALERYARCVSALESAHIPSADLRRRAMVGVARAQCFLGDGHLAVNSLRALSKEFPNDAEVVALFACSAASAALRGEVRSEVAPILMRRLLRMEAPNAALLHFVGDAAVSISEEGLALALYRRALTVDPSRPSPRVSIARLLRQRGDYQAARLELFAALAVVPQLRDATLELVRVGLATRSLRSVLPPLTHHCATTPTDIEALVLLAELLVQLERDSDARVTVDRVLRHEPDHPAGLWFDGVLLVRQSRVREAAARWRRITGVNVYHARAREALLRLTGSAAPTLGVKNDRDASQERSSERSTAARSAEPQDPLAHARTLSPVAS